LKDPKLYIIYIRECITRIESYTIEGKESFYLDLKTQDAVIRNLETLGDATQQLPEEWKMAHPEVEWRRISDFRNLLAHQYLEINLDIVWNVIEFRLPELRKAIELIAERFWNK
jgi:uncharacterized protein with HEPN domain